MKRNIIEIKEELCNGCGLCVTACHEGAIELIDGKARLISDEYCDGLGDCLPECPTGAILMTQREALPYDEELVMARIEAKKVPPMTCGCPGMEAKPLHRNRKIDDESATKQHKQPDHHAVPSELMQWPVQLKLVHSQAPYLAGADLLIAADCTAYAYGNFHRDFMKDKVTLIGCPKLDDNQYYTEKLTEIFHHNQPKSITVVRMQVPCCSGIVASVRKAMLDSKTIVPYGEVTISSDGQIIG